MLRSRKEPKGVSQIKKWFGTDTPLHSVAPSEKWTSWNKSGVQVEGAVRSLRSYSFVGDKGKMGCCWANIFLSRC